MVFQSMCIVRIIRLILNVSYIMLYTFDKSLKTFFFGSVDRIVIDIYSAVVCHSIT